MLTADKIANSILIDRLIPYDDISTAFSVDGEIYVSHYHSQSQKYTKENKLLWYKEIIIKTNCILLNNYKNNKIDMRDFFSQAKKYILLHIIQKKNQLLNLFLSKI